MFTLFSHVGIVVHDLEKASAQWTEIFGLIVVDRFDVPDEGVRSVMLSTGGPYGEATCVELIAPIGPGDTSGPISRRLAENGEGVFRVDDAAEATSILADAELRSVTLPPAGNETTPRVVVHPRSANGMLVELLTGPAPAPPPEPQHPPERPRPPGSAPEVSVRRPSLLANRSPSGAH